MQYPYMGHLSTPMNTPRNQRSLSKRRIPISSCITLKDAQDMEEACEFYGISISEMVARLIAKACHERFPTDRAAFDEQYPLHYHNEHGN